MRRAWLQQLDAKINLTFEKPEESLVDTDNILIANYTPVQWVSDILHCLLERIAVNRQLFWVRFEVYPSQQEGKEQVAGND